MPLKTVVPTDLVSTVWRCAHTLPSPGGLFRDPRRNPDRLHAIRDVSCDHRAGSYDGMGANAHALYDDGANPDVCAFADGHGPGDIGSRRDRHVVVNGRVMANENT